MAKAQTYEEKFEADLKAKADRLSDGWKVAGFKQVQMQGGIAYSCRVFFDGVWMGVMENDGNGGPDTFFRTVRPDGQQGQTYDRGIADWEQVAGTKQYSLDEEMAVAALLLKCGF